jgi:hypothetical protein
MENSIRGKINSNYTYTKSTYNPALDHLEGKILFKKKLDIAKEILAKAGLPKEVIEQLKREQTQ